MSQPPSSEFSTFGALEDGGGEREMGSWIGGVQRQPRHPSRPGRAVHDGGAGPKQICHIGAMLIKKLVEEGSHATRCWAADFDCTPIAVASPPLRDYGPGTK